MRVVEYEAQHKRAVVELMAELQDYERELSFDRTPGATMAYRHVEYLLDVCSRHSGKVFVALDGDGHVIGFVVAFVASEDDDDLHVVPEYKRFGWVSDLYVRPNYRGLGAASQLMQRAERHFASLGARRIKLAALHENGLAERFYASSGYRKHEVIYTKDIG